MNLLYQLVKSFIVNSLSRRSICPKREVGDATEYSTGISRNWSETSAEVIINIWKYSMGSE